VCQRCQPEPAAAQQQAAPTRRLISMTIRPSTPGNTWPDRKPACFQQNSLERNTRLFPAQAPFPFSYPRNNFPPTTSPLGDLLYIVMCEVFYSTTVSPPMDGTLTPTCAEHKYPTTGVPPPVKTSGYSTLCRVFFLLNPTDSPLTQKMAPLEIGRVVVRC